ncbi:MAG: tRNA (N6-threonylcarbamoyladenosine(37)-N6)-methyltransferase TrmO [Lachnospiraceae bacterium]
MGRQLEVIGHIRTDFPEKFGIPRQSSLVEDLEGTIIMEPKFRSADAFRGLEDYDYIWLLWGFSENHTRPFNATVKPPRLGGNKRMGVFATRSPYHPNDIGLSCVRLKEVFLDEELGVILKVTGVDQMDGTPIYDIKPYLPFADSHPQARAGFADEVGEKRLTVDFPQALLEQYPVNKRRSALEILAQDPRPAYQEDPDRQYGVSFAGYDIHFKVEGDRLLVTELVKL